MTVERPSYDAGAVVLRVLAGGPMSGFEIARRCEGRVIGQSFAWLYPVLYKLEAQGAITSQWQSDGRHMRRRYSLRGAARSVLAVWRPPADRAGPPAGLAAPPAEGSGPVSTYLRRLGAALAVRAPESDEIRREIADHFEDAGITDEDRRSDGTEVDPERLFGLPEQLATAMAWSLRERRPLAKTVLTVVLLSPALLLYIAVVASFVLAFLRVGVYLALRVGFAADATSGTFALDERQLMFPVAVGAFITARYVAGQIFGIGSRHAPAVVAALAAIGALVLGVPALATPANLDPVTVAVLVGIPAAFVLGAIRPARYGQRLFSMRGIAAAIALGLVVVGVPIDGQFAYSAPGGIYHDQTIRFVADPARNFDQGGWTGAVYLQDPPEFSSVCAVAQPAVLRGWAVEADPVSTGSPLCDPVGPETYYVNWGIPAPQASGRNWLLLIWVEDRTGGRHVVAASIVIATPYHGSVAGWLTGQPGE